MAYQSWMTFFYTPCTSIQGLLCLTSTFYFSAYSEQLKQYRDHCDVILNEITEALRYLQDLHKQHLFVSTKTGALHEACEQLLQDQVRYMNAM